ncbi:unnamed protein product [Protopolystoma xenopodis]|uniref:Uncharacterized protein n=1 Tax=Protopolystoma xenopodis TaxID=117903 RepID=A0A448XQT5_9PLAT|nr:unnamed protein product [Protopolystoma xenopodis]
MVTTSCAGQSRIVYSTCVAMAYCVGHLVSAIVIVNSTANLSGPEWMSLKPLEFRTIPKRAQKRFHYYTTGFGQIRYESTYQTQIPDEAGSGLVWSFLTQPDIA